MEAIFAGNQLRFAAGVTARSGRSQHLSKIFENAKPPLQCAALPLRVERSLHQNFAGHASFQMPGHRAGKVDGPGLAEAPDQLTLAARRYGNHIGLGSIGHIGHGRHHLFVLLELGHAPDRHLVLEMATVDQNKPNRLSWLHMDDVVSDRAFQEPGADDAVGSDEVLNATWICCSA